VDFKPFSLLDLGMNGMNKDVNSAHLALLMLLHYLVKFETLQMHVNTNLDFNDNYKIATKCIKLRLSR